MNRLPALLLLAAMGCARGGEGTDTTGAGPAAIDTLKAGPADSASVADSVPAGATTAAGVAGTGATSQAASRGTKTAPVDTTNIGRDRAIQPDLKRPRLPVVDTTKKPPQR